MLKLLFLEIHGIITEICSQQIKQIVNKLFDFSHWFKQKRRLHY